MEDHAHSLRLERGRDRIEAIGDFDGDGRDEFVIRSGWGFGLVRANADGDFALLAARRWWDSSADAFTASDTDDLLVKSWLP